MHQSAHPTDSLLQRSIAKIQAKPLRDQKSVWTWCVAATAFVVIVYLVLPAPYRSSGVLLSVVGSFWALVFYLHRRHAEDARFVKELLTEFNERYDKMATDLQFALSSRGDFERETDLRFVRYFNLCAEEWLFWRAGYIYDPVWQAWENGMRQYSRDPRVIALWKEEEKSNSYYGFKFPIVDAS
jgi:hypothetical protein